MAEQARSAGSPAAKDSRRDAAHVRSSADQATASARSMFLQAPITVVAIGSAFLWWASSFAFLIGRLPGADDDIPLSDVVGAFGMAVMPGLILILAGLVGSALMRVRRTETRMLDASESLLAPLRATSGQIETVGQAIAAHARQMNEALEAARASARAASGDIHSSCAALEAASGKAEAVTASSVASLKSQSERLATVIADLAQSVEILTNAISSHHATVTGALADTRNVVENADTALNRRLRSLGEASASITSKIGELDQIAGYADRATASLNAVLESLDHRIVSAAQQVSASAQAGSAMEDASRGAVGVLEETSRDAVGEIRSACSELTECARNITGEVENTLKQLRNAQNEAETRAKDVVRTARVESSTAEARIRELGNNLFETAAEATRIAEAGLDTARSRIEKASRLLGGKDDTLQQVEEPAPDDLSPPPESAIIDSIPTQPVRDLRTTGSTRQPGRSGSGRKARIPSSGRPPGGLRTGASASWRDILSDIDHDPSMLDQHAAELIEQFRGAGVSVRRAVTSPDLRRIAEAAQWGEHQRRLAVTKAAPQHVDAVVALFGENEKLAAMADSFVVGRQADMLEQLKTPGSGGADAQSQLIVWLLADVASTSGTTPDALPADTTDSDIQPLPTRASRDPGKTRKT